MPLWQKLNVISWNHILFLYHDISKWAGLPLKPSCYNVCKHIWNETESLLGSIIIITLWFEFNWGIVQCKFLQYLPTIFCLFLGLLTRFQLCRSFLAILSWVFVQVLILFLNEPVGGQPHSQGLHLPTPEAGWVPSLPLGWGVKDPGNEVGVRCLPFF